MQISKIRQHFPALDRGLLYLDNPGGTQIADSALNRLNQYLVECNSNAGGAFETSEKSDAMLGEARTAAARFLHAAQAGEIVFGLNMTSLTFNISRALSRTWNNGDTIAVTRFDHDANISPWLFAARDAGCDVAMVDFQPDDGLLDLESLKGALEKRPRLVAVGYASNALGTINPMKEIIQMCHEAGALVYVDAVHFAPHGLIDVQALDCDFLVCSAYKFFGPHVGILYGKYPVLQELEPYKVRPAPAEPPKKFETGTQNHEGIAGAMGAIEYLESLGTDEDERGSIASAMDAIGDHERALSRAFLEVFDSIDGLRVYGTRDVDKRTPTFSFTIDGMKPREIATALGKAGINVWDGHYYAVETGRRLGVEESGGMVRAGAVHYNTVEEIHRFGETLQQIVSEGPGQTN